MRFRDYATLRPWRWGCRMTIGPSLGCKQCANPVDEGKVFCSADCYTAWRHQNTSPLAKTLTCPNCQRCFLLKDTTAVKRSQYAIGDLRFCSTVCRQGWTDKKIAALREAGEALVEIHPDCFVCRVCGKELRAVTSHFSQVHGMSTRGITKSERQFLFGICRGERLVGQQQLDQMRELALHHPSEAFRQSQQTIAGVGDYWNKPGNRERYGKLQKLVPLREQVRAKVAATCNRNSFKKHVAACVTIRCRGCGVTIKKLRCDPKIYCSRQCANIHLLRRRAVKRRA